MRNTIYFFFFSLLLFTNCGGKPQENQTNTADSLSAESVLAEIEQEAKTNSMGAMRHFAEYGEDFQRLIISYDGVIREVALGMTTQEIKAKEMADLVKQEPTSLQYKTALSPEEYAEITYKLNTDGRVNEFYLKVILDNQPAYEAMLAELSDFFSYKYQKRKFDDKGKEIWQLGDKHTVDVSGSKKSDKVFEIIIDIR
jgi:hypothetical protein